MSTQITDFYADLAFSKAARQDSDIETLRAMFPRAAAVVKTDAARDRAGTDYVVRLRRGAEVLVDAKARRAGCSRYWRAGPEVALERWNVMPGGIFGTPREVARTGWALDEGKDSDLILFTFDCTDHPFAYARSFPLLREAFRRNCGSWFGEFFHDRQSSVKGGAPYQSECVFVPLSVLDDAIGVVSAMRRAS